MSKTTDIIKFATWYSGMDQVKVVNAYNRYLKEVPQIADKAPIESELSNDEEERNLLMEQYGISGKEVDAYMNQYQISPEDYVAKLVWSYLQYTTCQIDGKDATIIELKHVWSLINDIKGLLQDKQETIDLNVKANMELIATIQRMINEKNTKSSGFPLI